MDDIASQRNLNPQQDAAYFRQSADFRSRTQKILSAESVGSFSYKEETDVAKKVKTIFPMKNDTRRQ